MIKPHWLQHMVFQSVLPSCHAHTTSPSDTVCVTIYFSLSSLASSLPHLILSSPRNHHPAAPSPRHLITSLPRHLATSSPRHLVTSLPRHLTTSSPYHPITSSSSHPVISSSSSPRPHLVLTLTSSSSSPHSRLDHISSPISIYP